MRASPVNLDESISGNIRLESNFTRVAPQNNFSSQNNVSRFQASPSPVNRVEQSNDDASNNVSEIGAASRSVAALTENKSAIGRLDDLIEDFSKPISSQPAPDV